MRDLYKRGTEDMTGGAPAGAKPRQKVLPLIDLDSAKLFQDALGILDGVQRQSRLVGTQTMPVQEFGIGLLDTGAVQQQDPGKFGRGGSGIDRAGKPQTGEPRQIPRMV